MIFTAAVALPLNACAGGLPIDFLTLDPVIRHIHETGLYRVGPAAS